ncbi:MAG: glycosyltransferase family 2 protein [Lachnospiraceae bacterium]|nr:glycosyltransferase family 2 protein [Lachnospiraceae bacterium]
MLSVIIPAYNEKENIERTAKTVSKILEEEKISFELVFISDGSMDGTYEEICRLAALDGRVRGAEFSRNFGKEAAIFAGLELSAGDACIVMDCDLQHPPEVIPEMYRLWEEGFEVVEGIKKSRGKESVFHSMFAGMFYGIMSKMMKMDMRSSSDFKLLDIKVVRVLLSLGERNTFFRALSFWAGFRSTKVEYEVKERAFGSSKWSFRSLIKYAVSNVTSFSTVPLQMVTVMGIISILFSIVLAAQTLVKYVMGTAVEGFTTVILLILIIGGFIMISLGMIGHYLARIYEEVKRRPRYIIRRTTDEKQADRYGHE